MTPSVRRLREAMAWLAPPAACAVLYGLIFRIWFCNDDFAWLSQGAHLSSWRDWPEALFAPRAQGTIRPWSERLNFIALYGLFGLNPLPFRVLAFVTQLVNVTLLQSISLRLVKQRWAAVLPPLLWLASMGLATPMSWASSFNQLLCACFLLGALRLLIAAIETGRRRYWAAHAVVFLLGFGALEIHVVYPALAGLYILLYARSHWKVLPPLFFVSAVYALLHRLAGGAPPEVYRQHWDLSMLATFFKYLSRALAAGFTHPRFRLPEESWLWLGAALAVLLAVYLLWGAWRRQSRLLLAAGWFLATLGPVLPLRDHITDYYLCVPAIGLAWLAAFAVEDAWHRDRRVAGLVAAVVLVHGVWCAFAVRAVLRWRMSVAGQVQVLVEGIERAKELHPGRTILLDGVSSSLFWSGVYDRPFRLVGADEVFLVPGGEKSIDPHPELGEIAPFVMPRSVVQRALERNLAVVYQVGTVQLRNVTPRWQRQSRNWTPEAPAEVDAGQPAFDDLLLEGWYAREDRHRWMGKRAAVRLAGPQSAGSKLILKGFCPEQHAGNGPLELTVTVDGQKIGAISIRVRAGSFEAELPLPRQLVGRAEIRLEIEVNRTFRPAGDTRELGLAFGTLRVR